VWGGGRAGRRGASEAEAEAEAGLAERARRLPSAQRHRSNAGVPGPGHPLRRLRCSWPAAAAPPSRLATGGGRAIPAFRSRRLPASRCRRLRAKGVAFRWRQLWRSCDAATTRLLRCHGDSVADLPQPARLLSLALPATHLRLALELHNLAPGPPRGRASGPHTTCMLPTGQSKMRYTASRRLSAVSGRLEARPGRAEQSPATILNRNKSERSELIFSCIIRFLETIYFLLSN
jgi:hypothetical protein